MKKILSLFVCLVCLLSLPISVGQAPAPPPAAAAAWNNALQLLQNSRWQQADTAFNTVLMIAPNYAPAHMGRLLAQLQITEESLLADRVPPVAIDANPHFRAALEHADPAYRRQIQGYADTLNRRIAEMTRIQPGEHEPGARKVLTINDVEYAFRFCPPGTFAMGSQETEQGRSPRETLHQVTLTRGFWMLETEVTQLMWISVMGNNPSHFQGANLPVERVTWNDAQAYIQRLNTLGVAPAGFRFSLPTEAQWEYACRAGTTTAFHFGNTLSREQANFGAGRTTGRTRGVGSYPANAWGLRDMHGNVWEWVQDWSGDYLSGAITDPTGVDRSWARVIRGGSWDNRAQDCRSATRGARDPLRGYNDVGLRLVLIITDESAAAQTASENTPPLRELILRGNDAVITDDELNLDLHAAEQPVQPPPFSAVAPAPTLQPNNIGSGRPLDNRPILQGILREGLSRIPL